MEPRYFFVFALMTFASSEIFDEKWQWSWVCNQNTGKCTQTQLSNPLLEEYSTTSFYYASLPLCRIICDKYGAIWPKPTSVNLTQQLTTFNIKDAQFKINNASNEATIFLSEVIDIFKNNTHGQCHRNRNSPSTSASLIVSISIHSSDLELKWNTDESYSIDIDTKENTVTVKIVGKTVFGVRHAMETLAQLIGVEEQTTCTFAIISKATIKDKPVYTHRGLLLDTARNFLPVAAIKRQIDAMALSKLNVLHWHATDSQSFPLFSRRVPQLTRFGAYSSDKIYYENDVEDVIKYAKVRGVKVLIEIDAPSHAANGWQWGNEEGLGDLAVCVNKQPWRQYCIQPPCGQLNPVNFYLYKILQNLYSDIVDNFETDIFHMGGDEVFLQCWNSTKEIVDFLKQQGKGQSVEDFLYLWGLYQNESLHTFDSVKGDKNTPIILWSSELTNPDVIQKYLPSSRYVIQTWVPSSNDLPAKLLKMGYKLIISTKDAWYLDHGFWGQTSYYQWRKVYGNRLPNNPNVLGGEACMWGELVDENSVDAKVWPRTAAFAERVWSDPDTDSYSAESRFYAQRERLVTRGIQADATGPRFCYQNEGECT